MDLGLFKTITKYPFIYDEIFFDSNELIQNKTCLNKCAKKDCLQLINYIESPHEYVCSKGYDNFLVGIGDFRFILNGLILDTNKSVPVGRKEVRKDWIIDKQSIIVFIEKIKTIEEYLIRKVNENTEKNFSMFHDFKTSMSIFFSCTHTIINGLPGNSFEEKLKGSDSSYHDLYNSLALITSQLGMIDVIINPLSIEFGNQKTINIYRLFEKIKILFSHLTAKKRDITIKLIADTRIKDSVCFDSIEFIPLILLDNALKYSAGDSEIEIKFEQSYGSVKVMVKNIGPFVSECNKDKIFEKFFRDDAGKAFSKEGLGMGLWIAKQILLAHKSKLSYFRDPNETRAIGLNIFSFDLKTNTG